MIGRLVLSSRNLYKIEHNKKIVSARKCHILSEKSEDVLVPTSKEFNPKDIYIKLNNQNQIDQILGNVGDFDDDLNIYYHFFTKDWLSNKKYLELWEKSNFNINFDLTNNLFERKEYYKQVITIDPFGSVDLDDGFSFDHDQLNYYLDIHIADPVSYFDFTNEYMVKIFNELINRINTCYIPNSKGSNKPTHLLPEHFVQIVSLLENNKTTRAISFCFEINKLTKEIKFNLQFTNLHNIKNKTYEQFDLELNTNKDNVKTNFINLIDILVKSINLKYNKLNLSNNISHELIEVFMILVNYYGGVFLKNNNRKFIVREQEKVNTNINLNLIPDYCKNFLNYSANYVILSDETLSDKTQDIEHYALGIKNYTHVSSPMRRVIDMLNHLEIYGIETNILDSININKINNEIRLQKRLSNSYDLINILNKTNTFKAFVLDIKNNKEIVNVLLVLTPINTDLDFKKMIITELPQIFNKDINLYDTITIELYYNSNNFKSNKFPFFIKII